MKLRWRSDPLGSKMLLHYWRGNEGPTREHHEARRWRRQLL